MLNTVIFDINTQFTEQSIELTNRLAKEKIQKKGEALLGVLPIFSFFIQRNFKIGIASSSPLSLINAVAEKLGINQWLQAKASAENLAYGKTHPEVFLHCASLLKAEPYECLVFEDSLNGLIAAKASRMKCVVVPDANSNEHTKFYLADLNLSSLLQFNDLLLEDLMPKFRSCN